MNGEREFTCPHGVTPDVACEECYPEPFREGWDRNDRRRFALRRQRDVARDRRAPMLHPLVALVLEHDGIYQAHHDRRRP